MKTSKKKHTRKVSGKKRSPILRILALILALLLIFITAYIANAYLGNPITAWMAKNSAIKWMENNHPDIIADYEISSANYNWKFGRYEVSAVHTTSQDDSFLIYTDSFGNAVNDSYEMSMEGYPKAARINNEYTDLVRTEMTPDPDSHDPFFMGEYQIENIFGMLMTYPDDIAVQLPGALSYSTLKAMDNPALEELGEDYGHVQVFITIPEVSKENLIQAVLDMKNALDEKEVPWKALSLTIASDDSMRDSLSVQTLDKEMITPENIEVAVEQNLQEQEVYLNEMYQQKQDELNAVS